MKWKKVWEAVPVNYGTVIGCLENVLLRMRIKVNAQSENLRVVFSNRYGNEEMEISAAFLSQAGYTENIFTYCNPRFYSSPKESLSVTLSEGTV